MGPGSSLSGRPHSLARRRWLATVASLAGAGGVAAALSACGRRSNDLALGEHAWSARWLGASYERGHMLRQTKSGDPGPVAVQRQVGVLVVGGGVAGLSALRSLARAGVDDAQLLELEDSVGGNSRGHQMAGIGCPLGAHYLPVPGPGTEAVSDWLTEIGLLQRDRNGRLWPDERHLCHSPQERLFIDGAWQPGLLPAAPNDVTLAQYRLFARRVAELQRGLGFPLPSHHGRWTAAHAALDAIPFAAWLAREGLKDERLLGYLDYACRDDYGAGLKTVSAWAGLHYFASRHGFKAPAGVGREELEPVDDAAHDPSEGLFTWPEGNAWLVSALATPLAERLHTGRSVFRVTEGKHDVEVLARNAATGQIERWVARSVVLATPLLVSRRLLQGSIASPLIAALQQAAGATRYAPWLVANLQLSGPLLARSGAPPAWDNLVYAPAGGSQTLGYVDAQHQSLRPDAGLAGTQLLTVYQALPESARPELLSASADDWAQRVVAELARLHPDLPAKLQQVDLMRWGHAMSIPAPGVHSQPARQALRQARGRIRFAHADLAGYSVFEEAFTLGQESVLG